MYLCPLLLVALVLLLAGCGAPVDLEQEASGAGGSSPEAVAASFFEDLNRALQDPELGQRETRRIWAERLSKYFAPSERAAQRTVIGQTLYDLALSQAQLDSDQRLTIEIAYSTIEPVSNDGERATVRLVEGKLRMRKVREDGDGHVELLSEVERPLADMIGLPDGLFPVLRVNRLWFLTAG